MLKFTLDTNCLIDVDEARNAAHCVRRLLDAATPGAADVAMVASSASERQQDGRFLGSMEVFMECMKLLGLGQLPPLMRWGMGFWDWGSWADDELEARETLVYKTMFPTAPKEWVDFAAANGADPEDEATGAYFRWRNQILDSQAFWAHEHHERDVFVTSDQRFKRLVGNPDFPRAVVQDPCEAAGNL